MSHIIYLRVTGMRSKHLTNRTNQYSYIRTPMRKAICTCVYTPEGRYQSFNPVRLMTFVCFLGR